MNELLAKYNINKRELSMAAMIAALIMLLIMSIATQVEVRKEYANTQSELNKVSSELVVTKSDLADARGKLDQVSSFWGYVKYRWEK